MNKEKQLLEDLLSNIYHSYNENLRNKVEEGELIKIDDAENGDFFDMEVNDLIQIKNDLDDTVSQLSHKLVRLIGRQKEMENSISHNCDVVSAILQAYSSKKQLVP